MLDRAEGFDRRSLTQLQGERLRSTINRLWSVPFYRRALDSKDITPDRVRGVADLPALPFTTKRDLREQYPFGLFAVSRNHLARVHATSGTGGRPILVGYTAGDLRSWARLAARLLHAAGLRSGDGLHNALNYGMFTGGMGVHYGAEELGCWVIPASGGSSLRQIHLIQALAPAGIKSTPSYILHLADVAEDAGIDPTTLGLRCAILGAEPWSEALRQSIEERWGLIAYDSYGMSEMYGPGVAFECQHRHGLHLMEDHFLPEVIDPETGASLPPGSEGELVLTSLTKEAMPLLRYRTGDRTALMMEPCSCGRTGVRLRRIKGRTDEMLVVRGVNLFPSEVERILLAFEVLRPHYELILDRPGALDEITVRAELKEGAYVEPTLEAKIRRLLKAELGLTAQVKVVPAGALPRREGTKALRVIDNRKEV